MIYRFKDELKNFVDYNNFFASKKQIQLGELPIKNVTQKQMKVQNYLQMLAENDEQQDREALKRKGMLSVVPYVLDILNNLQQSDVQMQRFFKKDCSEINLSEYLQPNTLIHRQQETQFLNPDNIFPDPNYTMRIKPAHQTNSLF